MSYSLPYEPYYLFVSSPLDISSGTISGTINITDPSGNSLAQINSGPINGPDGLSIGPDGNLFVSQVLGGNVLKFNPATGDYLGTFTSDQQIINGGLSGNATLTGNVWGPDGNLYVSNFESKVGVDFVGAPIVNYDIQDSVLKINGKTGQVVQRIGIPAESPDINVTQSIIEFPALVASRQAQGLPYQGAFTKAALPIGLDFGKDGNLYAANRIQSTVYQYNTQTQGIQPFATYVSGLNGAAAQVQLPNGDWAVASLDGNEILEYSSNGTFIKVLGNYNNTALNGPTAMVLTPDKLSLIVSGYNSGSVVKLNAISGDIESVLINSTQYGGFRNDGILLVTPDQIGVSVPEPLNILGAFFVAMFGAFIKKKLK